MQPCEEPPVSSVIDFSRLEVRWTECWIWQIHENQSFLGRTLLRLRRDNEGSLADLSEDEWQSLRAEVRLFERFLVDVFRPDRFNYAQFGNVYHQLHIHAVPRYRKPRIWQGLEFHDVRWGANWAPTPPSPVSIAETYALAQWVRESMKSLV